MVDRELLEPDYKAMYLQLTVQTAQAEDRAEAAELALESFLQGRAKLSAILQRYDMNWETGHMLPSNRGAWVRYADIHARGEKT